MTKQKCTATTSTGQPCKAWAVHNTDAPRCAPHGGGKRPLGAPAGNTNALTHGFYTLPGDATIDDTILHLVATMNRLSQIIDQHQDHDQFLAAILAIQTQASSRLARLLRDKRTLSGEAADNLLGELSTVLDELAHETGFPPTD
jgi:hypothetical protein